MRVLHHLDRRSVKGGAYQAGIALLDHPLRPSQMRGVDLMSAFCVFPGIEAQDQLGNLLPIRAIGIRIGEQLSEWLNLTTLPGISFRLAFVFIALICLVGMIDTLHLTRDAGSTVSSKTRP